MTSTISDSETHIKPPENWPSDISYLKHPAFSPNLTPSQLEHLRTKPTNTNSKDTIPIISLSHLDLQHLKIRTITNPLHPAHGQRGLFALTHLPPGSLVTPYIGLIYNMDSALDQDAVRGSDYDIALDRQLSLGIDAGTMGNEGRCVNDYRGVSERPNAEFRDVHLTWTEYERTDTHGNVDADGVVVEEQAEWKGRKRKCGAKGIGVFVLSAGKAGKRKAGIRESEEVLVSYGKGFWSGRLQEPQDGNGHG